MTCFRYSFIFLYFFILLVCCICCNNSSTGFNFENDKEMTSTIHESINDSVYFRYPFRIRQQDSIFYVLDLHGKESYCFQLSYPYIKVEGTFASKGNGPEEFLSVENIRLNKTGTIYLLDANKETISVFNVEKDSVYNRIKLPKELLRSLDFALLNDSLFAIADYTGKCRIHIVDSDGKIQQQLFHIPTKKKKGSNISSVVLAQAWRSFMDYNPDNGILAMATQLGQVIEIYNLRNNEIVNILYGKFGEPQFVSQGDYAIPNGIMGYSDIHVGNNAIYAVFWGTAFKDIQKDPFNTKEGGNIVQVFSLEGKPLKQYTLDKHITGFSIDEESNKMIALDVNSDNQIIEYQL